MFTCDLPTLQSEACSNKFTCLDSKVSQAVLLQLLCEIKTAASTAMPSGAIIRWNGTSLNIPDGWLNCDGTNGTPSLSNGVIYMMKA